MEQYKDGRREHRTGRDLITRATNDSYGSSLYKHRNIISPTTRKGTAYLMTLDGRLQPTRYKARSSLSTDQ